MVEWRTYVFAGALCAQICVWPPRQMGNYFGRPAGPGSRQVSLSATLVGCVNRPAGPGSRQVSLSVTLVGYVNRPAGLTTT